MDEVDNEARMVELRLELANLKQVDTVLTFCRVITAQVDYIIALSDKDNHMIQVDEILCRRESR